LFIPKLGSDTRHGALKQMCELAADEVSNSSDRFLRIVLEREKVVASGWDNHLAIPQARINGLTRPLVVVGKSQSGIDFDARDGKPARLVIMILTGDNQSQHDLLADASSLFSDREAIEQALEANTFVELVAALNAPVS
jgi:mannitol/fructose-specific phosphotransferase system IIA component (Ntr-type)